MPSFEEVRPRFWDPDGGGEVQAAAERSDDIHDPDWRPPRGMVLVAGPDRGHLYVALDDRTCGPNGTPPVAWVDTEGGGEAELAPSFRVFVEGLRPSASFAPAAGVVPAGRRHALFGLRRRRC